MRTMFAVTTLLAAAAFAPVAVAAEPPICQPNPLTLTHPSWVRVPTLAVDLRSPPPASATNPLMQGVGPIVPRAAPTGDGVSQPANPLTHRL